MHRTPSLDSVLSFLFASLSLAFLGLLFVSLSSAEAAGPPALLVAVSKVAPTGDSARGPTSGRYRSGLEKRIRKELLTLPNYDVFDNISFTLGPKDIVTLLGQVRLPSVRVGAERVVSRIEGVRAVVNELEVLPASLMDEEIRRAAFFKLYSQSLLSRYALSAIPSIHIIVKNGNLTLEGVVDSEADRTVAELRVNQASNVFSVTNNLRVEQPQEASK